MVTALTVNVRWISKSPARRDGTLRDVASAVEGSDIEWSVADSPDVGALGLPFWTVVIFHAHHGDFERLERDVAARVAEHDELARWLSPLTE